MSYVARDIKLIVIRFKEAYKYQPWIFGLAKHLCGKMHYDYSHLNDPMTLMQKANCIGAVQAILNIFKFNLPSLNMKTLHEELTSNTFPEFDLIEIKLTDLECGDVLFLRYNKFKHNPGTPHHIAIAISQNKLFHSTPEKLGDTDFRGAVIETLDEVLRRYSNVGRRISNKAYPILTDEILPFTSGVRPN